MRAWIILMVVLAFAFDAEAAIYYVGPSGTAGSCSTNPAAPGQMTWTMANCLTAGVEVQFRGGTYTDRANDDYTILIPQVAGTSVNNRVTLKNYSGEVANIRPSTVNQIMLTVVGGPTDYVTIDGLNGGTPGQFWGFVLDEINGRLGGASDGASGIYTGGSSNWIIRGVEIKDFPYAAFTTSHPPGQVSNGHLIQYNKVHGGRNVAPGWSHGIYFNAQNVTVEHNEVYNIVDPTDAKKLSAVAIPICPSANDSSQYCDNVIVRFNYVHDTAEGIYVSQAFQGSVYGNIVARTSGYGILLTSYSTGPVNIFNNTIYDVNLKQINQTSSYPGDCIVVGSANVIKNNIAYNCAAAAINELAAGSTYSNNLGHGATGGDAHLQFPNTNPLLVNPNGGDFRVQSGSPAINTGANLGYPYNVDYAGGTRPQGAGWDIGAYEFTSTSITITSPTSNSTVTVSTSTITLGGTSTP